MAFVLVAVGFVLLSVAIGVAYHTAGGLLLLALLPVSLCVGGILALTILVASSTTILDVIRKCHCDCCINVCLDMVLSLVLLYLEVIDHCVVVLNDCA